MVKKKTKTFNDAVLVNLSEQFSLPILNQTSNVYFDMLENIVSQQLSGKVASKIFQCFLDLFPNKEPLPQILLWQEDAVLRGVGLSAAKVNYVKALAEFAMTNDLSVDTISKMSDVQIIDLLIKVKGIGKWTVQKLLIFSLGRVDVFPVDDLAVQVGMKELYGLSESGAALKRRMELIAESWMPNRTTGTRLVWAYVNSKKSNAVRR